VALSWSLFGVLTVMCGGLLAALYALVGRRDGLAERFDGLAGRMDGLAERMDGLDRRMDVLTTEVRLTHADVDRRLRDGGL
jgi:hypothetical protein